MSMCVYRCFSLIKKEKEEKDGGGRGVLQRQCDWDGPSRYVGKGSHRYDSV